MPPPDLPFELKLTLRSGTVYYFEHRGVYSNEPHFFVVLNADPLSDNVLIMAIGSSQVDKVKLRRKALPPETLVVIDPSEFPEFTKPTIMDCNQVFELSKEELIQKFESRNLRHHRDLPSDLLDKIWIGIRTSPRVDEVHKQFIPPA